MEGLGSTITEKHCVKVFLAATYKNREILTKTGYYMIRTHKFTEDPGLLYIPALLFSPLRWLL